MLICARECFVNNVAYQEDIMRQLDFSPLYRSTVGFDRLFSMMDQLSGSEATPSYPPYDIERTGDNTYRIVLAVAGFTQDDLTIEFKATSLLVKGERESVQDDQSEERYLYRGIARRSFERRFQLADHMEVTSARLENGLLQIDLKRELPEALKTRQIAIESVDGSTKTLSNKKH
jgi:molecular chaperone IbpA